MRSEDDASRLTAESALKKLGRPARAALLKAAAAISRERESESRTRQLRSALGLLAKMGIPRNAWPFLRPLLRDPDAKAAVLACQICLDHASVVERRRCARRLIELLMRDDWMLREDIEACLIGHLDSARQEIERYLHRARKAKMPQQNCRSIRSSGASLPAPRRHHNDRATHRCYSPHSSLRSELSDAIAAAKRSSSGATAKDCSRRRTRASLMTSRVAAMV